VEVLLQTEEARIADIGSVKEAESGLRPTLERVSISQTVWIFLLTGKLKPTMEAGGDPAFGEVSWLRLDRKEPLELRTRDRKQWNLRVQVSSPRP
jgi:hypothetical protein